MIEVFGLWLVAANINYVSGGVTSPAFSNAEVHFCDVSMVGFDRGGVRIQGHTCDEVVKEIKSQVNLCYKKEQSK